MSEDYETWLKRVRAKGRIQIIGATAEELRVFRAALSLYEGRNMEKHAERPQMGWGATARVAGELIVRIE